MKILIPMAGEGSRFAKEGYTFPKPLVDVNGKPMIQAVVENLDFNAEYIFLVRGEHLAKYKGVIFEDDIIILEKVTNYNSNDIYAIQIDDSEITLKKIKLIKDEIEIFGDRNNFSSIKYKKDRIKILGKMINLVRKY